MTLFVILFFIFVGLAFFHFWWEGIIAPSIRLELRFDVFKMRDVLRRAKIEHGEQLDDELFDVLQHVLNKEIAFLHRATLVSFYSAYKRYANSEELETSYKRFQKLVAECALPEIKNIAERSAVVTVCAMIVNSGGWLVYVVPILLLAVSFRTIQLLSAKLLVGLSDKEVNRSFPDTSQVAFAS
jgi:hypothetical protein